jgi:SAM-dependent methyltransferase
LVAAGLAVQGRGSCERAFLEREVGVEVDLGGGDLLVLDMRVISCPPPPVPTSSSPAWTWTGRRSTATDPPCGDLRAGSVAELPFADATFDLVTCMDVVEHLPELVRAPMFGEVRRVLKPGGRFVLQTPHAGTFQVLDAQNPRHRFPGLYRRLVRRGVRDQTYDGRQDVVWHKHFTPTIS